MADEPEQTQETPAAEFRRVREQGERITIRSTGRVVRMRVVKPAALLRLGKIPNPLSELVMSILHGTLKREDWQKFFALPERIEQELEMLESLRVVCTAALVYPHVVDEPQSDDEIHIDDLEDGEQRFIFDLALMEATALSRFRLQQEAGVEPVGDSTGDEQPTEPVDSRDNG